MLLLPGVYQVAGPCKSHHYDASAYLFPQGEDLILIDCGTREGFETIVDNIRSLGFDPSKVSRIYATHGHYDHIGGASCFRALNGTKLFIHPMDRIPVETGDSVKTTASLLYGVEAEPIRVDGEINEGDRILCDAGEITVLHTPGHSPGSCCFVLRHICGSILLISGDTLHGGYSPLISSDISQWKESLARLTAMHFDYYVFGHHNPQLLCDADERIRSLTQSFANYFSPWFKDFYRNYTY